MLEELYYDYKEARCGKRGTLDEHVFELNLHRNLVRLRDAILEGRYKPGRGIAFITRVPVIREIFAAPFKDRIVHHFLYHMVAGWWDRRFIYDSYSCRVGKGVLMGQKRLEHAINQVTENGKKRAYVIKLDIQGYFMSLDRKKLYKRVMWGLDQQFKDRGKIYDLCRYLWREVIFDDPTEGVRRRGWPNDWDELPRSKSLFNQPEGRGIVIGNLSSQLLSNIYLDQLDRFITMELGYKHYGRYVDDFYIVVPEEQYKQAKRDVAVIEEYLAELGLTLHPKKRYCQEVNKGVPFLGVVVYPGRIVPGRRIARNFKRAVAEFAIGKRDLDSVISYVGHLQHIKSDKLIRKVYDKMGWDWFCGGN